MPPAHALTRAQMHDVIVAQQIAAMLADLGDALPEPPPIPTDAPPTERDEPWRRSPPSPRIRA